MKFLVFDYPQSVVSGAIRLGLALVLIGWVLDGSQSLLRASALSLDAQHTLSGWDTGLSLPRDDLEVDSVNDALVHALAIRSRDPDLLASLGQLQMVIGGLDKTPAAQRRGYYLRAAARFRESIALRPNDAQSWASLAAADFGADNSIIELQQAWTRAKQLGPEEGHIQPMLMQIALATWPSATEEMKSWVERIYLDSSDAGRAEINRLAFNQGLKFSSVPAN